MDSNFRLEIHELTIAGRKLEGEPTENPYDGRDVPLECHAHALNN